MGKFVYVYKKNQLNWDSTERTISKILNINSDLYVKKNSDELLWISGSSGNYIDEFSFATGQLHKANIKTLKYFSFKMLCDSREIIIFSDICSSRSVWYVYHKNQIIISSSQRVIVSILGSFELNPQAIAWMISTGCLGPGNSWDHRISHLKPNRRITFSKADSTIKEDIINIEKGEQKIELANVFENVFDSMPKLQNNVGILLSGGFDSRATICALAKRENNIKAFSWGFKRSIENVHSDAGVASAVAKKLNIPFKFLPIEIEEGNEEELLNTFILNGEGRIDHLSVYADGLKIWKDLYNEGIKTVIRSDEAFGWIEVSSEKDVRISLDLNTPYDYKNLARLFAKSAIQFPKWDEKLNRNHKESKAKYRDRLYKEYRIPYILAALHDLVLSYVEIVNPLLHSSFISWASNQKDKDRSNKKLYRKYVNEQLPDTPIAVVPSTPEPEKIVNNPSFKKIIYKTLDSNVARDLLGAKFINEILINYKAYKYLHQESTNIRKGKNLIPFFVKKILRKTILPYKIDNNRLVFRAFIVVKMNEVLVSDVE